ncbi:MAG TPA: hypothetical protein VFE52_01425 [Devosia sp.]|jgi:hypothetical protein|nr:hypothetical protein [Devosia sp.]
MHLNRALAVGLLALAAPGGALAQTAYDQGFANAFGDACIPGRLTYETTLAAAAESGWQPAERDDHPELLSVMARADEEMGADDELGTEYAVSLFGRNIEGTRHHLTVTYLSSVVGEGEPSFAQVGCNLYNFDAEEPVDPAPVSALLQTAISHSIDREGLFGYVWGPPCPMPRTFDTYLSYLAADTPAALATGFSGVTLNFSTSSPAPGEVVPETYC